MVCDRCIMAVRDILDRQGLKVLSVELGCAVIEGTTDSAKMDQVKQSLTDIGFDLLNDKSQRIVESIKNLIIHLVWKGKAVNLSVYLSDQLHTDYSTLSKLFSETEGITIEKYHIFQRVERVKELIRYDELSLSEIASLMNYSSTAYLCTQFKAVTGMTPTQFKADKRSLRRPIDKIGQGSGSRIS